MNSEVLGAGGGFAAGCCPGTRTRKNLNVARKFYCPILITENHGFRVQCVCENFISGNENNLYSVKPRAKRNRPAGDISGLSGKMREI